jgi:proteasome lid subunit RPN8/RPN11
MDEGSQSMSLNEVTIPSEILVMVLQSARTLHPKETIFLLRGKAAKNSMIISELIIPPAATYGRGFSTIPMHMLPMDFSIVGTIHSHPSGNLTPSSTDLNKSMGKVIIIVAFPYQGVENVAAYNRYGKRLNLHIT